MIRRIFYIVVILIIVIVKCSHVRKDDWVKVNKHNEFGSYMVIDFTSVKEGRIAWRKLLVEGSKMYYGTTTDGGLTWDTVLVSNNASPISLHSLGDVLYFYFRDAGSNLEKIVICGDELSGFTELISFNSFSNEWYRLVDSSFMYIKQELFSKNRDSRTYNFKKYNILTNESIEASIDYEVFTGPFVFEGYMYFKAFDILDEEADIVRYVEGSNTFELVKKVDRSFSFGSHRSVSKIYGDNIYCFYETKKGCALVKYPFYNDDVEVIVELDERDQNTEPLDFYMHDESIVVFCNESYSTEMNISHDNGQTWKMKRKLGWYRNARQLCVKDNPDGGFFMWGYSTDGYFEMPKSQYEKLKSDM